MSSTELIVASFNWTSQKKFAVFRLQLGSLSQREIVLDIQVKARYIMVGVVQNHIIAMVVTEAAAMVFLPPMVVVVVMGTVVTSGVMGATEYTEVVAEMVSMHMETPVLLMKGM